MMKERTVGFLSNENIDHESEIFDYIRELHGYLWRFVRAVNSGAVGNLKEFIDDAVAETEKQMKAKQREPWLILTQIGIPNADYGNDASAILCSFCKHAAWTGSQCGEDNDCECEHPLIKISDNFENEAQRAMDGGDCWGFRPDFSREDAVDIVGIWLNNEWPDWDTVPRLGKKLEN